MSIIPMRDLKNTVEVERRCAEENGPGLCHEEWLRPARRDGH